MHNLQEPVHSVTWPEGKRFAFSIFDDTDGTTMQNGPPVYEFLANLGFRTTKSVWPVELAEACPVMGGTTCDDPTYAEWAKGLQGQGFEIGLHGVTNTTACRKEWIAGLQRFCDLFGDYPITHANHVGCQDSIYWGEHRLSGAHRQIYNLFTGFKNRHFYGHRPNAPGFWGDLCQKHIKYVRNFVFADINTLNECPYMPYHDPLRPFVRGWFASSEGSSVESFTKTLSETNQERLEIEGGACIMYTHFGSDFFSNGRINPRFANLMQRLSLRPGWFVPVSTLLDYLEAEPVKPSETVRIG